MNKAIYDRNVPTRNLVTTITGIITLVVAVLVSLGVLTPELSSELTGHAISLVEAVSAAVMAISGIISIFKAKDA